MAKILGSVTCEAKQIEMVKGLLKRRSIYVIKEKPTEDDKTELLFRFYKHQAVDIQKVLNKITKDETV